MDPIIKGHLNNFTSEFRLKNHEESKIFEHFINYIIINKISNDRNDFEKINVGGTGNPGIDGLAIIVNNHLTTSTSEVDYFIENAAPLDVEFNFIQSKTSHKFDMGEISTFLITVKQFFEKNTLNFEDELMNLLEVKDYIYEKSIHLISSPKLKLYYATTGVWKHDINLLSTVNSLIDTIKDLKIFTDVIFVPIDADKINLSYREIANKIQREIVFEKHTILPNILTIEEAYLGYISAEDFIKLITDSDNEINKSIFYDNVRDFQGYNKVNTSIKNTIQNERENDKFVLLNNGITIVARSLNKIGNKFKITDYQIVNGCQTSHVIFENKDLIKNTIYIPLKLIVTKNDETISEIIKATNSQTEVKNEAFEILRPFHKKLEEFYLAFKDEANKRIYYERRAKQFGLKIKQDRIIGLSNQINAFLSMFLNEPHSTHRYFGELLKSYESRIFLESHKPWPYYTSGLSLVIMEEFFRDNKLLSEVKRFKFHLLLLLRHEINGNQTIPKYDTNNIEKYCGKILEVVWDEEKYLNILLKLQDELIEKLKQTKLMRRQAHSIKSFTEELLPDLYKYNNNKNEGRITYYDKNKGFGFIRTYDDKDFFFHRSEMPDSLEDYNMEKFSFTFESVITKKGPQAKNMKILKILY